MQFFVQSIENFLSLNQVININWWIQPFSFVMISVWQSTLIAVSGPSIPRVFQFSRVSPLMTPATYSFPLPFTWREYCTWGFNASVRAILAVFFSTSWLILSPPSPSPLTTGEQFSLKVRHDHGGRGAPDLQSWSRQVSLTPLSRLFVVTLDFSSCSSGWYLWRRDRRKYFCTLLLLGASQSNCCLYLPTDNNNWSIHSPIFSSFQKYIKWLYQVSKVSLTHRSRSSSHRSPLLWSARLEQRCQRSHSLLWQRPVETASRGRGRLFLHRLLKKWEKLYFDWFYYVAFSFVRYSMIPLFL